MRRATRTNSSPPTPRSYPATIANWAHTRAYNLIHEVVENWTHGVGSAPCLHDEFRCGRLTPSEIAEFLTTVNRHPDLLTLFPWNERGDLLLFYVHVTKVYPRAIEHAPVHLRCKLAALLPPGDLRDAYVGEYSRSVQAPVGTAVCS